MKNDTLKQIKEDFNKWSGFSMEQRDPEEILREIDSIKYKLECEISDYASSLRKRVQQLYNL